MLSESGTVIITITGFDKSERQFESKCLRKRITIVKRLIIKQESSETDNGEVENERLTTGLPREGVRVL